MKSPTTAAEIVKMFCRGQWHDITIPDGYGIVLDEHIQKCDMYLNQRDGLWSAVSPCDCYECVSDYALVIRPIPAKKRKAKK